MDEQDDFDSACHEQEQQEARRRSEPNSGVMDPALFTTPMPALPYITPRARYLAELAQAQALEYALRRLFR